MELSIRAGLILTNDKNEYLVVKDSKSKKWSFPKGGKEEYEVYLTQTAEREMFEETGFVFGTDYIYNPCHHICSLVHTKEYSSLYYFFVGKCFRNELYFKQNLEENVEEIKFVCYDELIKMNMNYVTKNALAKLF